MSRVRACVKGSGGVAIAVKTKDKAKLKESKATHCSRIVTAVSRLRERTTSMKYNGATIGIRDATPSPHIVAVDPETPRSWASLKMTHAMPIVARKAKTDMKRDRTIRVSATADGTPDMIHTLGLFT